MRARFAISTVLSITALFMTGCASYTTPAGGVSMDRITDGDIATRFRREPAAQFPARIAIVRVQDSGYRNYRLDSYGNGRFSVVTARDFETEEDFERLGKLPQVAGVAALNRMVLPEELESDKDIRVGAASVKADLLLAYTVDTRFRVDDVDVGPLGLITLGFIPNRFAKVRTTASAAIFDVRTGYVYGLAEAGAETEQIASVWSDRDAVDDCRVKTEREAFTKLIDQLERTWSDILHEHGRVTASHSGSTGDAVLVEVNDAR